MKFSAVIFDWDGTLGMTLHLWLEGYRNELKNLGFNFSDETIVGDIFYEHVKAAVKYPEIDFKTFVPKVLTYINSHIPTIKTYQGAYEMLKKLKDNGIILTLVTSSTRKLIEEELKQTNLTDFFSVIISSDEMEKHKPDPGAFHKVIKMCNLDPKSMIVLGDAENDILAARAAGITSCLFLPTENKIFYNFDKLKETNPAYCVENLSDFIEIVI